MKGKESKGTAPYARLAPHQSPPGPSASFRRLLWKKRLRTRPGRILSRFSLLAAASPDFFGDSPPPESTIVCAGSPPGAAPCSLALRMPNTVTMGLHQLVNLLRTYLVEHQKYITNWTAPRRGMPSAANFYAILAAVRARRFRRGQMPNPMCSTIRFRCVFAPTRVNAPFNEVQSMRTMHFPLHHTEKSYLHHCRELCSWYADEPFPHQFMCCWNPLCEGDIDKRASACTCGTFDATVAPASPGPQ
eukprot:gene7263-biopygen19540